MILDELLELYILEDEKLSIIALTNNIYKDTDIIYKVIPPINVNKYVRNIIFNKVITTIYQDSNQNNNLNTNNQSNQSNNQNNNNQTINIRRDFIRLTNIEINIPPIISYSTYSDVNNYIILNYSHIVNYIAKTNVKNITLILEDIDNLNNNNIYSKTEYTFTNKNNQTIKYNLYRNISNNKYYVVVSANQGYLYNIKNKSSSNMQNFIQSLNSFILSPFSFFLGTSQNSINQSIGLNTELANYVLLIEVSSDYFNNYNLYDELTYIPVYSPRLRTVNILNPSDKRNKPLSIYTQILPASDIYVYIVNSKIVFNLTYKTGSFVYYPRITLNITPVFVNISRLLSDSDVDNYLNGKQLYYIQNNNNTFINLNGYLSNLPNNLNYYFVNTNKPSLKNYIYTELIYTYNSDNNQHNTTDSDNSVFVSNITIQSSIDNIDYILNMNNYIDIYNNLKNIYNNDKSIDKIGGVDGMISAIHQMLNTSYHYVFNHLFRNVDYRYIQPVYNFSWLNDTILFNIFKINTGYNLTVKSVEINMRDNNRNITNKYLIPVITSYNKINNNTYNYTFNFTSKYKVDTKLETIRDYYSVSSDYLFSFVNNNNYVGISKCNKVIYKE